MKLRTLTLLASLGLNTACDSGDNNKLISVGGETQEQIANTLELCPRMQGLIPVAGCNDGHHVSNSED